ncbi:hypothetical protein [Photobacterium kasasachensis]|uniref:hypothetical protein n=1 Tax=Photobacterium kasasachensis TaxID=2910240 RepID=UPI003D09D6F5
MKNLSSVLRWLIYIRECVFFEAHLLDIKSERGPVVFPAFIVGVFDAMISFLVVLCVEKMVFPESGFTETYLSGGMFNLSGFIWVFLIFLLTLFITTLFLMGMKLFVDLVVLAERGSSWLKGLLLHIFVLRLLEEFSLDSIHRKQNNKASTLH